MHTEELGRTYQRLSNKDTELSCFHFNNLNFRNQKVLQEQVEQLKTKLQEIKEVK